MHFLGSFVAAVATIASLANAAPAPSVEKRGVAKIVQKVNPTFQRHGPKAYAAALSKYGATVPQNVLAAAAGTGTVAANPEEYDSEYLCPVSIGGQTLNLDFDT